MSVVKHIIEIGFDRYGEPEFGVNCSVSRLSFKEMNELRTIIPVAIGVMEQMWRDHQMDKPENRGKCAIAEKGGDKP